MSAAELEAESSAQEQQRQQQQQNEHNTSNNSTANNDAEATTYDDVDVHETNNDNNNYDNNNGEQQLRHNNMQQHAHQQQQLDQQGELGVGLSLMQSSPPPHSYRHSRAYRHFKNPPQPHMCIRTTTETGEELFINVLSWTRIVIPQEPSDPIPLYGGMRVPPGSPRSPPIVFAVMANPEVLKDSGRHSKDPEERRAMVELMCDFVEAMNPGVKLVRNAVILKDRDISGELKDVWNAVQAQRDREREEQMLQQRQQQHYQNITTQQMFPKSPDAARAGSSTQSSSEIGLPPAYNADLMPAEQQANNGITLAVFAQQLDNKVASEQIEEQQQQEQSTIASEALTAGEGCVDQTDAGGIVNGTNGTTPAAEHADMSSQEQESEGKTLSSNGGSTTTTPVAAAQSPGTPPTTTATPNSTPTPAATATPAKKEKLGGFLPNGCIFPRFKNNKHKDKDSSHHKESKSKEKTLLNALKKSKEKKVAPSEQTASDKTAAAAINSHSSSDNGNNGGATTQYEKNCINNLECEVQKLDLNSSNNDNNMFIKLKVAPSATATAAAAAK
ncbi:hypothetical protein KR093_003151 [Drosophila rubida]|uniref:PIH1 domain-containing protein 2 n=1 Tax=Drosophila rubida TaxID=30044 RepID=A0AAD4PIE5_9MUSC|nr:hypothetical protein KR093_003151 [Drosophila rubida]